MVEQTQWTESLKDGSQVLIRPTRLDDEAHIHAFVAGLSPLSKHYLFLAGVAALSGDAVHRLCDPDGERDMVYIAFTASDQPKGSRRAIGFCRYAGADPIDGAEMSVVVADDWQHKGLGRLLLNHLIDHARANHVPRLYSIDAFDNKTMGELARHVGFKVRRDPDDVHQVIYELDIR